MMERRAARPPEAISDVMRRVRSKNTAPEMALRRAIWHRGRRYRVQVANLPGRPDLVFISSKLVVFVDGDFWHGNQWRRRGLSRLEEQFRNTGSSKYWVSKIRRNKARDARKNKL